MANTKFGGFQFPILCAILSLEQNFHVLAFDAYKLTFLKL